MIQMLRFTAAIFILERKESCSKLKFSFLQVAIVGAPVTTWEAYDTGYTERYMSTPAENPLGYKMSSVLNYASRFPDEYVKLWIEQVVTLIIGIRDNIYYSTVNRTKFMIEKLLGTQASLHRVTSLCVVNWCSKCTFQAPQSGGEEPPTPPPLTLYLAPHSLLAALSGRLSIFFLFRLLDNFW